MIKHIQQKEIIMNYKLIAFALSLGVLAGCRDRCGTSCGPKECKTEVCKDDAKMKKDTTRVAVRESGPLSDKTVAWDDADYGKSHKEDYNVA